LVADSGLTAIDRVFDLVDGAVDRVDRVLNRNKRSEEAQRARRAKRADVDTAPSVKVRPSRTLAARRFEIVEAIDSVLGTTLFIVTNGDVKAECTSRAFAEQILRTLEIAT
jgi:hypothetical protein